MNTTVTVPDQNNPDNNGSSLKKHFLAIVFLSGVMFLLLDSATDDEVLDITRLLELQSQDYDYFMEDVDSVHYTYSGFADYRLQAQRVTHYPSPEFSLIESPLFLLYSEDSSAWEIKSAMGRYEIDSERNQERLNLIDDVIISGITADGSSIKIYTDALTLYPSDKTISTDSDVLFESEGFSSSSKGITADLNSNIFRQLASGKLKYDN